MASFRPKKEKSVSPCLTVKKEDLPSLPLPVKKQESASVSFPDVLPPVSVPQPSAGPSARIRSATPNQHHPVPRTSDRTPTTSQRKSRRLKRSPLPPSSRQLRPRVNKITYNENALIRSYMRR
ncbi:hypothetical protein F5051DRAFT_443570 [Lentinula edodes]|nr:hypothetical protein F5051DRAFT_443570 [Lentinula edodes]